MEQFTITKIRGDDKESAEDFIAREIPFTLIIGNKELVTLLCSPLDLEDLVRGFLFTSGLIKKVDDIERIVIDDEQWIAYIEMGTSLGEDLAFKRLYTSGCGRGTLFYNPLDIMYRSSIKSEFRIKGSQISELMADFQRRSHVYLKTGCVHSAALADKKNILVFREDIGRHNAIDKVIGNALLENNIFYDKVLITSGRLSSEVFFKARRCSIPVVISRSAPTNQAVRLAREMDITLVGFARGKKMNVYSGEQRIQ